MKTMSYDKIENCFSSVSELSRIFWDKKNCPLLERGVSVCRWVGQGRRLITEDIELIKYLKKKPSGRKEHIRYHTKNWCPKAAPTLLEGFFLYDRNGGHFRKGSNNLLYIKLLILSFKNKHLFIFKYIFIHLSNTYNIWIYFYSSLKSIQHLDIFLYISQIHTIFEYIFIDHSNNTTFAPPVTALPGAHGGLAGSNAPEVESHLMLTVTQIVGAQEVAIVVPFLS